MIRVSWPNLLLLPLILTLVGIFLCGIYYALRRRPSRARISKPRLYRCTACGHVYEDLRDVPLARCSRCDCMNEAVKR